MKWSQFEWVHLCKALALNDHLCVQASGAEHWLNHSQTDDFSQLSTPTTCTAEVLSPSHGQLILWHANNPATLEQP